MTQFPKTHTHEQGFTLVELAIVMIIIGLLIGGILKGQELITNARVSSTISQVKAIDAAINTFRDRFDGLPGDILTPATRLTGCNGVCAPAAANANGRIGPNGNIFGAAPDVEMQAAFVQLAAADLLGGINAAGGQTFGGQYPQAEIGGGFHIGYVGGNVALSSDQVALNTDVRSGHYLALHDTPNGAVGGNGTITPSQAFRIDNKLDNGIPGTGSVLAAGAATCINGAAYNESLDSQVCSVYIRIQQ